MLFTRTSDPQSPIDLAADQFLHWEGARTRRLCVQRGRVWVTVDGDADDHVLDGGQCLVLPGHRHALLQPLDGSARIRVDRLAGAAP